MLAQSLVVVLMAAAVQAAQQDGISMEPPAFPQVTNVTISGTGCSPGTANATWSTANWSDWVVSLHNLNLEATTSPGGITGRPPSSSDCTIHATFAHPSPGWQLALETVSIRGYAALSSGSSVEAGASTSWSGTTTTEAAPAERNVSLTNSQPTDQTSAIGALLDFSSVPVWSACSSILSPDLGSFSLSLRYGVHVQANATTGVGYAAFGGLVDDGHGEVSATPAVVQHLQWAWRPCTAPVPSMGSTTYFPKPKTTTTSTSTSTSTAAGNVTATAKPTGPFSNSTSVSSTETTTTVKTTVTATTTTTTHVLTTPTLTPVYSNTTASTKSLPPTTLSTSTRPLAKSTWSSLSSTIEPHWTTATTTTTTESTTSAATEFITGSTYQTSVTGTSFSFSFIDDPPEATSTATTDFPLITSSASGWSNITMSEPLWANSTTTRVVLLPTQN